MGEPLILALDGSTDACSAALLRPCVASGNGATWEVVAARGEAEGRSQARILLQLVDHMLREAGGAPADLAAIVVGIGPGTFTGVRITVATARALALSLHVHVVGISTLAALAAEAVASEGAMTSEEAVVLAEGCADIVVPVIDARRDQVFYSVYRRAGGLAGGSSLWERSEDHGVCDRETLPVLLRGLGRGGSAGARESGARLRESGQAEGRACRILMAGEAKVMPAGLEGDIPGLSLRSTTVAAEWLLRGQEKLGEPGLSPAGARLPRYLLEVLLGADDEAGPGETEEPTPGEVGSPEAVRPIYVRAPDADVHITKMRNPWAAGP
jgi:tRNA threonylcarbamoyl adenosine modification protein YeaZ